MNKKNQDVSFTHNVWAMYEDGNKLHSCTIALTKKECIEFTEECTGYMRDEFKEQGFVVQKAKIKQEKW